MRGKRLTTLLFLFVLPLILYGGLYLFGALAPQIGVLWVSCREKWFLIKKGMSEEEVKKILGPPDEVFETGEVAKFKYYTFKPRPVSGKCFAYESKRYIRVLYVYFDEEGKVEEKFIGSSD